MNIRRPTRAEGSAPIDEPPVGSMPDLTPAHGSAAGAGLLNVVVLGLVALGLLSAMAVAWLLLAS